MISQAMTLLAQGKNLQQEIAYRAMIQILSGEATPVQIASFLTALRVKGESVEEITACAKVMREKVTRIQSKHPVILDTCGTGGDGGNTFNISTAAAIVAAGAGAVVAKHGNRAISSKCGSSDVLKALGVNVDQTTPEKMQRCLDEIGIAFLFAPLLHGAMKYAAPIRRELGFRTIFNILGPLTNPAGATRQLIGVYEASLIRPIADVLLNLGVEHALVVHGAGGFDEISTLGATKVNEIKDGKILSYEINPEEFGFEVPRLHDLLGGDAEQNAHILLKIFQGERGPCRDITVLNSGAALMVTGLASTIKEGIQRAQSAIDDGSALKKLDQLREHAK
ncbi:MAG: anthranilate phosphoribosyltransferase [Bacteroidota bacterium]